ncbi:MAG: glycosyltransferase family 39 protein [Candidatus Eisenbacteria bacterium]
MSLSTANSIEPPGAVGADVQARTLSVVLPLLVLLGAFLRFYRLGGQSLWVDEILTLKAANVGGTLALRDVLSNIQGPLHAVLVHFVARFSTSEPALRGLSALAGVATIPVVYLLGKDVAGRRVGLISATLIAVSPFAVWYSQEVRNYSFLILLSATSTLAAWRIIVTGGRAWGLYAASVTLALYSNLSAAFLWLAHTLFGLGRLARARRLMKWAATCLAIALLFLPLLLGLIKWVEVDCVGERIVVAPLAENGELLRGATTFSPLAIPYSIFTMVYGYSLGPSARELHTGSPLGAFARHLWLVIPAGVMAAVGFILGFRRLWVEGSAGRLVAAVVVVSFLAAAVLALLNIKPFNVRYVAVMLPVIVVTMSAGVATLSVRRGAWLWAGVVLFSLLSLGRYYFVPEYSREDVRGAARYVAENERPGDIVLVPVVRDVFAFYYEGAADYFAVYRGQTASADRLRSVVEARAEGHERLWFVESRLWHMDEALRTPIVLGELYREVDRREFAGATVTLYDLDERPDTGR